MVTSLLFCIEITRGNDTPAPKTQITQFIDNYLGQLINDGHQLKVVERSANNENLNRWKDIIAPTFPIMLRFNNAARVVFEDSAIGRPVALFVFQTPKALKQSVTSFDNLTITGVLHSEVQTYYSAVVDGDVFVILLSEQKRLPSDSQLLSSLSKVLAARRAR